MLTVLVHLDEEAEREGLTEALLARAVRERLDRNGVPRTVETLAALRTSPSPWVEITVSTIDLEFGRGTQITKLVIVYLVNYTGHVEGSSIWRQGYLGASETEDLQEKVRAAMIGMVDQFSLDWHNAN